jgi:UDP-3-O-[3-hydroxymyristoyl] glucosamine N-acyltransferase
VSAKFEAVEDESGKVTRYVRHTNGGGLIAPGAVVAESARIGPMTYVEPGAQIGPGCRIGHGSWIDREAKVGDRAVIGDGVRIGRGTVIGNRVHIGSHSRIGSSVLVGHGVHLHADSTVPDGGRMLPGSRSPVSAPSQAVPQRKARRRLAA